MLWKRRQYFTRGELEFFYYKTASCCSFLQFCSSLQFCSFLHFCSLMFCSFFAILLLPTVLILSTVIGNLILSSTCWKRRNCFFQSVISKCCCLRQMLAGTVFAWERGSAWKIMQRYGLRVENKLILSCCWFNSLHRLKCWIICDFIFWTCTIK